MVQCGALLLRVDQILILVRIVGSELVCIHRHIVDAKEVISLQSAGTAANVSTIQIFQSRLFSKSSGRHSNANYLLLIAGNGYSHNWICYNLSFYIYISASVSLDNRRWRREINLKIFFFFERNASTQCPFHTWKGKKKSAAFRKI